MRSFDSVVVGLGSIGSQVLRHLAVKQTGTVLGIEQFSPAYTRTAVGGDTRLFRYALPEGPQYHQIIAESLTQWNALNERTGRMIYQETGCLYIGGEGHPYMRELLDSVAETGAAAERLTEAEATRRYPQHRLWEGDIVVYDPHGGFVRTDAAVQSSVALATGAGAEIVKHDPVRKITRSRAGGFTVTTATSVFAAGDVIIAGGGWSGALLSSELRTFVEPRRTALMWFGLSDPDAYAPDRFPVFKRVSPGINIYGAPTTDGTMIKIALSEARRVESPDRVRQSLDADELTRVTRAVAAGFTSVVPDVVRSDAFPELYTADYQPLIGRDPGTGAYLATGFSGKGFKMSAGIGKLVADAVVGGDDRGVRFADPARFLEV
jgi:sarcosine oxidase